MQRRNAYGDEALFHDGAARSPTGGRSSSTSTWKIARSTFRRFTMARLGPVPLPLVTIAFCILTWLCCMSLPGRSPSQGFLEASSPEPTLEDGEAPMQTQRPPPAPPSKRGAGGPEAPNKQPSPAATLRPPPHKAADAPEEAEQHEQEAPGATVRPPAQDSERLGGAEPSEAEQEEEEEKEEEKEEEEEKEDKEEDEREADEEAKEAEEEEEEEEEEAEETQAPKEDEQAAKQGMGVEAPVADEAPAALSAPELITDDAKGEHDGVEEGIAEGGKKAEQEEDTQGEAERQPHLRQEGDERHVGNKEDHSEDALDLGRHSKKMGHSGDLPLVPIPGVSPERRASFEELFIDGGFRCQDGSKTFEKKEVVNDDFCDCSDGSDEPGTSACAGLQVDGGALPDEGFACGWRLSKETLLKEPFRAKTIHRSFVNDGICDCCGGEDEWDGAVACPDNCQEELKKQREHEAALRKGSEAREALLKQAQEAKKSGRYANFDGGPQDVYFAIAAQGCLELLDAEYRYDICLFGEVNQRSHGKSFKLGTKGEWASVLWEDGKTYRKDYSTLVMDGGTYCAARHGPRRAELHFECDLQTKVVSVQETEVCVYAFAVKTPAACNPSMHDH